jgi:hypothetical protein
VAVQLRSCGSAYLVSLVLLVASSAPAGQDSGSKSISELLDRYQKGQFDVVGQLADASDPTQLQFSFIAAANAWIARDSSDIISRRLVATAFAIEVAQARLAFDNPTLIVLLDWARKEWRKGPSSSAERVWTRAAVALIERGGRVNGTRTTGNDAMARILRSTGREDHGSIRTAWGQQFIGDAADRFPDDSRLRLANVLWQRLQLPYDLTSLERLAYDAEVGPDALVELAMLVFLNPRVGAKRFNDVRSLTDQAARRASEPTTSYLAHFIAALSFEKQDRIQDAMWEYAAALKAIPQAQCATLSLAQLLLRDNQADAAFELVNRSMTARPEGDDPWRLFEYGGYIRWPLLIADVRKAVH